MYDLLGNLGPFCSLFVMWAKQSYDLFGDGWEMFGGCSGHVFGGVLGGITKNKRNVNRKVNELAT